MNRSLKNDIKKSASVHNDSGRTVTKKAKSGKYYSLRQPKTISDISQGPILSDGFDEGTPVNKIGYFRSMNNHYVSSENGTSSMTCNREAPGEWETFSVIDNGNGTISLRGSNGKFVSRHYAPPSETDQMICDRDSVNGWERFNCLRNGDGTYSLQGDNDKFVTFNYEAMTCFASTVGDWEKFNFIPAPQISMAPVAAAPNGGTVSYDPGVAPSTAPSTPVPVPTTPVPTPTTMPTPSVNAMAKYWWVWYLLAAIIVIIYILKGRK